MPSNRMRPDVMVLQAQQEVRGGRLAGPGLADDGNGLPTRDGEADTVDSGELRGGAGSRCAQGEDLAQVLDPDEVGRVRDVGRGAFRRGESVTMPTEVRLGAAREQPLGVLVPRPGDELGCRPASTISPRYITRIVFGAFRGECQVVGDEEDRRSQLGRELFQLVQDPALDGHVEGRGGFVGDEQLRPAGQAHRDQCALAHPAGELVRVLAGPPLRGRGCRPGRATRSPRPVRRVLRPRGRRVPRRSACRSASVG